MHKVGKLNYVPNHLVLLYTYKVTHSYTESLDLHYLVKPEYDLMKQLYVDLELVTFL